MTAQNNWPSTLFNSGYAFQIDSGTHPKPTQIRLLQSSSLSMKASNKELMGQEVKIFGSSSSFSSGVQTR
jgi:hypothetical protein